MPRKVNDRIVAGLYEAAVGTRPWSEILDELTVELSAHECHVLMVDKPSGAVALCASPSSTSVATILDYVREFHSIDPHAAYAAAQPIGQVFHTTPLFPRRRYANHRFYREFWASHNLRSLVGAKVAEDDALVAFAAASRTFDQPEFTPDEIAFIGRYLAHLQTALGIRANLVCLHRAAKVGRHLIERADRPMVLLDGQRRIAATNASGRAYLAEATVFGETDGRLVTQTAEGESAFGGALAALGERVSADAATAANRAAVRVPGRDGVTAMCTLWDLAPEQTMGAFGTERSILLSVAPKASGLLPDRMFLAAMFGLTPAEARIASALAGGDDLAAIAASLHLSVWTVRSQLKSIFAKTGTRRQAELVRLLVGVAML